MGMVILFSQVHGLGSIFCEKWLQSVTSHCIWHVEGTLYVCVHAEKESGEGIPLLPLSPGEEREHCPLWRVSAKQGDGLWEVDKPEFP